MDAIESRIPVDAYTISSLINAYCATRADAAEVLDQAFAIVELGRFLDVRQTPAVTNSLLRACVAAGDLPRAARTFEETVALAEDPDTVADSRSVRILLEAFAAAGDVPGAMARVDDARKLGVVVDESACVSLVRACVDAGMWRQPRGRITRRRGNTACDPRWRWSTRCWPGWRAGAVGGRRSV